MNLSEIGTITYTGDGETEVALELRRAPYDGQRLRLTGETTVDGKRCCAVRYAKTRYAKTGMPVEALYVPRGDTHPLGTLLNAAEALYSSVEAAGDQAELEASAAAPTRLERFIAELLYTAGALDVNDALEAATEPGGPDRPTSPHALRWAREIAEQLEQADG